MGLLDGLTDLLFGTNKGGGAQAPSYQPYTQPVPQYQQTALGQQSNNQLGDVLRGRLSAYQRGGSTLDPAYRKAVLGDAQASANTTAQLARNQLGEQLNKWGLLNSSAAGYGLGKIGQQQQLTLQNAANYLTEQDLGNVNQLTGQAQMFGNSQNQLAGQQLAGQQFGYNAGEQQNENVYNSQLNQYSAAQKQRQGLLSGLFGLGKAAVMSGLPGGNLLSGLFKSSDGQGIAAQNGMG